MQPTGGIKSLLQAFTTLPFARCKVPCCFDALKMRFDGKDCNARQLHTLIEQSLNTDNHVGIKYAT